MELPLPNETWLSAILFVVLTGLLIYWYIRPSDAYWKELGIPFVPAKPLVGSVNFSARQNAHDVDVVNYKKYGRMYGTYEGSRPVLILSKPDLLRNVLVKDFPVFTGRRTFTSGDPVSDNMISIVNGEKWKRIRCIVTPAFSTGKIKRMTNIILSSAKTVAQNFASKVGIPVNGKEFFGTFTMDVIASVAFATKIHSYQDPKNRFIQEAKKAFSGEVSWRLVFFVVFPRLMRLLGFSIFAPSVINFFKDATMQIIRDRRETGKTGNDFLQLLIDAEKETREPEAEKIPETSEKNIDDKNAEDLGHEENNAKIFKMSKKYKYLSEDEMISQCVIFFLAGYETTASTLSFASYSLALNPDIQDKLSAEVDSVIRSNDGKLTYAGIQEMKYLDQVVSETLRMFPPAVRIERVADVDYTFENTNITIKKDTVVACPVYALHHDAEHYPEPEKFKPERFTAEEKALRHPYSYLSFGAGPRNCVAMRFALMEVKLCLAYMVSQFRIKQCPETEIPLLMKSGFGLLQPKSLTFTVEKRENRVFDGLTETTFE